MSDPQDFNPDPYPGPRHPRQSKMPWVSVFSLGLATPFIFLHIHNKTNSHKNWMIAYFVMFAMMFTPLAPLGIIGVWGVGSAHLFSIRDELWPNAQPLGSNPNAMADAIEAQSHFDRTAKDAKDSVLRSIDYTINAVKNEIDKSKNKDTSVANVSSPSSGKTNDANAANSTPPTSETPYASTSPTTASTTSAATPTSRAKPAQPSANSYIYIARQRRIEARHTVESDPMLALRMQIGRPDLDDRTIDDGGLIDINHAPKEALTTLPGIDTKAADEILLARDVQGSFQNFNELLFTVNVNPKFEKQLREYAIFIP